MKFKKIEISAFRIYDNPSDATFDFLTESGEVANFVALYAPNGFGKTSFYDAVEWAVTKSINRFYIRSKELQQLAHYQYLENELPLIRNSKSDRETYVNILFDDDQAMQVPFKKHGKQKHDLNFDKPLVHNFQRVILSQEWISAFLTESNGETRYKKFMENPELIGVSNYYSNLKHIQAAYNENTSNLEGEISFLRIKIVNDGNNNLLTNINNQIVNLRDSFSIANLRTITLSTTQEEIKTLKDFISEQTVFITREIEDLERQLEQFNTIVGGNDKIVGATTYYSFIDEMPELTLRLAEVQSNLSKFEQMEILDNQLSSLSDQLKTQLDTRDATTKILSLFDSYEKTQRDVATKSTSRADMESQLPSLNNLLDVQVKQEVTIKSQIDSSVKRILTLEESLAKIPETRQLLEQIGLRIKTLERDIEESKINFRELSNAVKDSRHSIQNLNNSLTSIRKNDFSNNSLTTENTISLNELKQTVDGIELQRNLLASIRGDVAEQREFNNAMAEFIQTGLRLVNEGQLSDCPLCEHPYGSHTHLAEKISKNRSLDRLLQDLLLQESQAATKLSDLEKLLLERRLLLEKVILEKIASFENELKRLLNSQEIINKKITDQQNELRLQSARQFEIQVEFKGISIDDYATSLSNRLTSEIKKRNELNEEYTQVQTERERLQGAVQITKQEINRLSDEIATLSREVNYNAVIRWFELNSLSKPSRDELLKRSDHVNTGISAAQEQIQTTRKDLEATKNSLISFDKISLKTQQKEFEGKKHDLENAIETFALFAQKAIEVDSRNVGMEALMKILSEKEIVTKTQINSRKKLSDELLVLNRYCENIIEFLQSERLKIELQEKEDEFRFLVSTVGPRIENEIQKTKDFLMSKIKEFFYTNLINDIYKKIDPHPDFREVRFKADFDSENPRLDIFVKNSKNAEALIPNLYFSTAQINILSLSIFLASALNSQEYKCIFVDDPIQSMDSINVLSTIDLIRSIVVNGDRQIILSTHDKNFYDVLQKKIPNGLFKSKFLELESFGKVKVN